MPGVLLCADETHRHHSEVDVGSVTSSSSESVSGAPSRLVPGHRMWANRNGRHILGLIEDYNALRKQISEGRKLSRSMDAQLQQCVHTLRLHGSDNKVPSNLLLQLFLVAINVVSIVHVSVCVRPRRC